MPQLKSLRSQVGSYGRVAANGIVEVDEPTARRLLDTKRFVAATAADIKAAQGRMADYVAGRAEGEGLGFAPIAAPMTAAQTEDEKAKADDEAKAAAETKAKAEKAGAKASK